MRRRPASSARSPSSAGRLEMQVTSKPYFESLAAELCVRVSGAERITLYLKAEQSDFIRFNGGAVRQATHVTQGYATLAVVQGARRIEATLSLSGRIETDRDALLEQRGVLLQ